MTIAHCDVAIVGSGFAGSLLARILATLGYDVTLFERGSHPRFAIGESSTPMANLTLERLAARYGLADCRELSTHGRWIARHPEIMRGLKRGFTYYRHHRGEPFADKGFESERLLVAASPDDAIADTHWLRADVDHHFVRKAVDAGVNYLDRAELTGAAFDMDGVRLTGTGASGAAIDVRARFIVDASGPGGFLTQQLSIPSDLGRLSTRSALVFGHFNDVALMSDLAPGLPAGPYPDDWAAVHHLIDEGWMYSLRFDDHVTSAGFLLSPSGLASLGADVDARGTQAIWDALLARYPTIAAAFDHAAPHFPIRFVPRVQHRAKRGASVGWAMLPHTYAFIDPLFSTGIAWSLRGVERLALAFEHAATGSRAPNDGELSRYNLLLTAEADQIDHIVAGAYAAMSHFDLFAAHAMIYFAIVSFGEVQQRLSSSDDWAWTGFLGTDDLPIAAALARESHRRLNTITMGGTGPGTDAQRREYVDWVATAIAPRNIAGLADPARRNLYPVDLDVLVDRHALLGLDRASLIERLPRLRGAE